MITFLLKLTCLYILCVFFILKGVPFFDQKISRFKTCLSFGKFSGWLALFVSVWLVVFCMNSQVAEIFGKLFQIFASVASISALLLVVILGRNHTTRQKLKDEKAI